MSMQHVLPTGDAGEKMSALCLVLLIYFCLTVKGLSRSKTCPKNLNRHRIEAYYTHKHSSTFIFKITFSVSIVCRQLLVGYNNMYRTESHIVHSSNTKGHCG